MPDRQRLEGSCHCGALRVVFFTDDAPSLRPRACACSFCRKHGVRAVSDPRGEVRLWVHARDALLVYRFGLRVTDMIVCRRCGVYVGARMEEAGRAWMTVNANALDDDARVARDATPVRYDAEDAEGRIFRRKSTWTPARTFFFDVERADARDAVVLLRAYFEELGAQIVGFDPSRSVSADPDEMIAPRGTFLVAREHDAAIACGGLKTHAPGVGEVKRMYVAPSARGLGLGRELLQALEASARALGMRRLVLDTASSARAAIALYRSAGFSEVPAFNDNPFATLWLAKDLRPLLDSNQRPCP